MLQTLSIENFTIVEYSFLDLNQGLTTITGETGAGKSILIDALNLVLGGRADSTTVRQQCEQAQITAQFCLPTEVQTWLSEQNISTASICQIKRIINKNGRSRALLNDKAISIQLLRTLGEQLVDIHGQHAHQSLLKTEIQRQVVDSLLTDKTPLKTLKQHYQKWKTLKQTLHDLGGNTQDREEKLAFLRYQVEELQELDLTLEAIQETEKEHKRFANAHKLLESSQRALNLLDTDEGASSLSLLSQASHELNAVQQHDNQLTNIIHLLETALIQTQEAIGELRHYVDSLDLEPGHLQELERKITKLQDMARKHKVRYTELPAHFDKLVAQLTALENYEQRASQLETEIAEVLQAYRRTAEQLHNQREAAAKSLAEQITYNMHRLGMPGGHLLIDVAFDEHATPTTHGMDIVEFLVTTNPGHSPKPLNKVASGGELSRISLAIQVITAQYSGVPTLIFDEVDVGIGGGVAEIVGQLLQQLAQQRQVLCITHLPQVACQGHQHLQVTKTLAEATTHTQLTWLNNAQRVTEIARMLGGVEMTEQTIAHAQEMLQRNIPKDYDAVTEES